MNERFFSSLATPAVFWLAVQALPAFSAPPTEESIWELISAGQCSEARKQVQEAEQAEAFIATAEGKSLYAKCLCCSPAAELSHADIANAKGHLEAARSGFDPLTESMRRWLDDVVLQCDQKQASLDNAAVLDEARLTEERIAVSKVRSNYTGKVMSVCKGGNLSPELVPSERRDPSEWRFLAPRPSAVGGGFHPGENYLARLKAAYVGDAPKVAICAPFIALSSTQDPGAVCRAAHRFTDYFSHGFGARRPPVWIALYHYPMSGDQLYRHASKTTGDIRCDKVLGYFDWRRQAIVNRAPPGSFGTFQHELTHALVFWDMPLVPRWIDEGLAALFENTDGEFRSLPNPWREEVLERAGIQKIDLDTLTRKSLAPGLLQFEADPVAATVAREYLRRMQGCGDLPGLYRVVKDRSSRLENLSEQKIDPFDAPPDRTVREWADIAEYFYIRQPQAGNCR